MAGRAKARHGYQALLRAPCLLVNSSKWNFFLRETVFACAQ